MTGYWMTRWVVEDSKGGDRHGRDVLKKNVLFCTTGLVLSAFALTGFGQTATPGTSTAKPATVSPATPPPTLPKAPPTEVFPPVNPKNFTASSPTVETVNSFLHALWGYDEARTWSVAAIEPTVAPGVVRVQVYVSERSQPGRLEQTVIYVTPDGKHAIAGEVVNFGAQPFAETRALLQQQANGPARGGTSKDLEFVEFADLQCPHCKEAQATLDKLAEEFPQARVVFEDLPLTAVHPFAMQAAEVGQCVRKAKGDPAFFTYAQRVYDTQADLMPGKADATLRAAVTAAGADPAAAMTCAGTPAAQDAVNATLKLAADLGVTNTPTLVVNGRALPLSQIPLEALRRVIVFQGSLDGLTVHEQPSLTTLK